MTFRQFYTATLPVRAVDLALHGVAAWLLPWHWVQFAPDILLPFLWMHGMWTGLFLPHDSKWLELHRVLHLRRWTSVGLLPLVIISPWIAVHFIIHAGIDLMTHGEQWR